MESRKQDDAREDLERHIMSRERVWQFEIEHREEEWMLFSRLYGTIVRFCWGVMSGFLVDVGLVRPVKRGRIRLSL